MPIQVEVPGHGIVEFPDGMSDDQISAVIRAQQPQQQEQTAQPNSVIQAGKGMLSGAADIGNNLINAATFIPRKIDKYIGSGKLEQLNQERQSSLQDFNRENDGTAFTLGRIGANIAGTLGAAPAAGTALAGMSQAPKALALANALKTSGAVGTLGEKIAGSAGAGALATLLTNPEDVLKGATIGAAIPLAGAAIPKLGNMVADAVGNLGTHTGGESIRQAAKAGMAGGDDAARFAANLRGKVPMQDVVDDMRSNIAVMGKLKGEAYRSGMVDIAKDKTILAFKGIDDAIDDAMSKVTYKGQVKNQRAAEALQKAAEEVNRWKSLDAAQFHTPEGMDALKQRIGAIMESIPMEERTAGMVVKNVYNSVKNEINRQAPTYAKVMKDYADASDEIYQVERGLLGSNKATVDSSMRRLQSLLRNNANTNYGNRLDLANTAIEKGGRDVMPALAGQALSSVAPRGLGNLAASATGVGGLMTGNPLAIPLLAAQSPRLVGEGALKAGQLARILRMAPFAPAAAVAATGD